MVAMDCIPEEEDSFNRWYNSVHMPLTLRYDGLLGAVRFRKLSAAGDQADYLTVFRFRDQAALDAFFTSPEVIAARDAMKRRWNASDPVEIRWRAQYENIGSWEK